MLVRLYDTHRLYSLAGNHENDSARAELTTIMTDLMTTKLSHNEMELITDVMLALMKQAEQDLKQALAERLSTYENVPLRVILALANDEISIAEPVLRASPVLQDMDLAYILQAKGVQHGRVIASREGLGDALINMLVDTKDFAIAINLCENDGVKLTAHAYDILTDLAKGEQQLAQTMISRHDLPQAVAEILYDFVGGELKKAIKDKFDEDVANDASIVLDEVVREIRVETRPIENYDLLLAQTNILLRRGELKIPGMVSALRRGQSSTFLVQFSVYTGLPVETVRTILKQESGKALAITCRALDIQKADFISIYLLTEKFRNTEKRIINHTELSRLMSMYDMINQTEAQRFLGISKH